MTELPPTIKTRFIPFDLEMRNPQFQAIRREREAAGVPMFECYATPVKPGERVEPGPERDVLLETKFIFGDQWNAAPDEFWPQGYRVFNFLGLIRYHGDSCRHGHWLHITDEMREVCRLTHKCGFCASQYFGEGWADKFCERCLDSEYLKQEELYLLRLKPVLITGDYIEREPLTPEEQSLLLPAYVHAQTEAEGSRAVAKAKRARRQVEEKYEKEKAAVEEEYVGMLWLLDHNIPTDNVIYYSHKNVFCFGWRSPLSADVESRLLDLLSEFPFRYEFKGGLK